MKAAVRNLGGEIIGGHPSSCWFVNSKLLLTVYVDDLLLSGPVREHAPFWGCLRQVIDIEDPEPLDRFLGRTHLLTN